MSYYPILYKRNTNGSIQQWQMEIDGDRYRSHSGQMNGAIVSSEWTTAKPKNVGRANATTGKEQADLECQAEYTKKKKRGYTSTPVDAQAANKFAPMLAKKWEDHHHKLKYPVYVQPKLDGIRIIAKKDGLWSRTGERIVACPHIEACLFPLFQSYPDLILDGEGYNHDLHDDFNTITSLMRKQHLTPDHVIRTKELVQYYVYDLFMPARASMPFSMRQECLGLLPPSHHLVVVPTLKILDAADVQLAYEQMMEAGYEGAMVREDIPYQQKRTDKLLKLKQFEDAEFEIVDLLEGRGNASGGIKIAVLKLDIDPSETFKADVMGTVAYRRELLSKRESLIGKMATVKFFSQRTPAGIPRWGKLKQIHEQGRW